MRYKFYFLLEILLLYWILVTPSHAEQKTLLIFGDSLSAAYGIAVERGWVALLQRRIEEKQLHYTVINASISGETSAGALSRLPALLNRVTPDIALIQLGTNDGLRGISTVVIKKNLNQLIATLQGVGTTVVLVQMHIPPNYGPIYTRRFDDVYRQIAAERQVQLVPFILQNMFDDSEFMQDDGLHPKANAQPLILNHVWSVLGPLLE